MRTYQTLFNTEENDLLEEYSIKFNYALHSIHQQRLRKESCLELEFCHTFNLTSRQKRSVENKLDGMENSQKELKKFRISNLKNQIKTCLKKIENTKDKFKCHNLKRRLHILETKFENLEKQEEHRFCFGSRKLFSAQHHLEKNGFSSHQVWLSEWQAKRNSQFFVLGSKDEKSGNQSCQLTYLLDEDCFSVKLRLIGKEKRYLNFKVDFKYGKDHLIKALEIGQAITYRFKKDEKGWRLFAITKPIKVPQVSDMSRGCIGVDFNNGFISINETDRFGNTVNSFNLKMNLQHLSSNQAKTKISEVVKQIVNYAKSKNKPISIEKLDFTKLKTKLRYASTRTNKMLSSLAYSNFKRILMARSYDSGLEVHEVNPAYTSKIGQQKYARRYGLSIHLAAGLVIARRGQRFRDSYVSSKDKHLATTCKDRSKHVVLAEGTKNHGKAKIVSVAQSPKGDPCGIAPRAINLCEVGEIPIRESSVKHVRLTSTLEIT